MIALYNPVSAARRETFERALRILREHRAADTPVVVARNLGRAGERVDIVALDAIDPARIDMLTVLIVGSSKTRDVRRAAVNPCLHAPRLRGRHETRAGPQSRRSA